MATTKNLDSISDAIQQCFISPNVLDSNCEASNVVDAISASGSKIMEGLSEVANSITPMGLLPHPTRCGGAVGSLTESFIYLAENLGRVADALERLADAKEESE